ncbi:hypothetical protein U9M48_033823 [Paspalum notatum var. saurae]|uniref:F-box domain-containing protein n=1 Tax=Paspalum notatum var. saurae TaxID=547442 RepID=A0AAQ3X748_PASNO
MASRKAKRRRTAPPSPAGFAADGGGGVDMISGLCDDVLVRILERLPDARDVLRTGALSRRWRGLWTRVSALRFATEPEFFTQAAAAERYIAFVNDALALRAAAQTSSDPAAVEHLAVSLKMKRYPEPLERKRERGRKMSRLVVPSVDAAHGWIRYAVQHGLRSLAVDLRLPARAYGSHGLGLPVMLLGGLPSSDKLETMRLGLGGAMVTLPAAAQFASLTDLSLERMVIADVGGDDDSLARLLSTTTMFVYASTVLAVG